MHRYGLQLGFILCVLLAIVPQLPGQIQYRNPRQALPSRGPGDPEVTATFRGEIDVITKKQLDLLVDGGNYLTFRITSKTVLYDGDKQEKLDVLRKEDPVSIDATRSMDGTLEAVRIRLKPE